MLVVSDTSPIRALAHLDLLALLPQLYRDVVIPPGVLRELQFPAREYMRVDPELLRPIRIVAPEDAIRVTEFGEELDPGESEAIALALELHADAVLIDERKGRTLAHEFGLTVIGTLGVLRQAKLAGLIDRVRPHVERIVVELRFFLDQKFAEHFLKQIGE